jgi:hypothetical protein
MATYKVIQDVEAEDKILGPLSLKQLIFAAIAAGTIFIAFRLVVATGAIYAAIPFLPIILAFGVLAAPLGRDQPTEMWLAAQIRFYTKPRTRIWDQSGIKNLVTITAPVRQEKIYTDGLDQQQVRSRLKALSSTLDSRGWAVKNVDLNLNTTDAYNNYQTDRLVDPSSLPIMVSDVDVRASDDILDVSNNETAQHFDELMQQSSKTHHEELKAKMQAAVIAQSTTQASDDTQDEDVLFDDSHTNANESSNNQPYSNEFNDASSMEYAANSEIMSKNIQHSASEEVNNSDELSDAEKQIIERARLQKQQSQVQYASHHRVVLTAAQQAALAKKQQEEQAQQEQEIQEDEETANRQETGLSKTDTIELANANLKISTIQGLAKHKIEEKRDPTEVVVKLH